MKQAGNGIKETEGTVNLEEDTVFNVQSKTTPPYQVVVEINELPVSMEINTGAAVSIMSREIWEARFAELPLAKPTLSLRTYTAERMAVLGEASVHVSYGKYCGEHTLYVVEGSGPTLLGQDWLHVIPLDWASIKAV